MIKPKTLKEKILEIENSESQKITNRSIIETFELYSYQSLVSNLSGNYGALFVRAMLSKLNIDEYHVFKWRLENKFKQYQILNYYVPGCMPKTFSFSKLMSSSNGVQIIRDLFTKGFFLKAALGDASFATNTWDKTREFEAILDVFQDNKDEYETYILQKKLRVRSEFRVHTFCKEIIPGLIYRTQGQKPKNNHTDVKRFLTKVLNKLPNNVLEGTLIGWDIARTVKNEYYIIEANFTGFHPEYRAGFQTTGIVDDHYFGPIVCAWLNIYFKNKFRIYVDSFEKQLFTNYTFYQAFAYYMSVFKDEHLDFFNDNSKENHVSTIIYLGEDTNKLVVALLKYFLMVDFSEKYYIISREEYLSSINNIFSRNDQIEIISEKDLLDNNQLQVINQLSYDRRRIICCYHMFRRLKNESYVIL